MGEEPADRPSLAWRRHCRSSSPVATAARRSVTRRPPALQLAAGPERASGSGTARQARHRSATRPVGGSPRRSRRTLLAALDLGLGQGGEIGGGQLRERLPLKVCDRLVERLGRRVLRVEFVFGVEPVVDGQVEPWRSAGGDRRSRKCRADCQLPCDAERTIGAHLLLWRTRRINMSLSSVPSALGAHLDQSVCGIEHEMRCWPARRDSNPRPTDPKSVALSTELRAVIAR
jgi:hypothetical protein